MLMTNSLRILKEIWNWVRFWPTLLFSATLLLRKTWRKPIEPYIFSKALDMYVMGKITKIHQIQSATIFYSSVFFHGKKSDAHYTHLSLGAKHMYPWKKESILWIYTEPSREITRARLVYCTGINFSHECIFTWALLNIEIWMFSQTE